MLDKIKILSMFFVVFAACQSDDPVPPLSGGNSMPLELAGVQLTDANGQPIGCLGDDCTDDWTNRTLTANERRDVSHFPQSNWQYRQYGHRF